MTLLHIAVQRGKFTNKFNNLTTTCQWRISYTSINISLLTFTILYEKHAKHFDLACLSVHKSLSVLINLYLCCRFTLPSLQGDFHVYNNLEFSIKGDQDVAVWNYLSMIFFLLSLKHQHLHVFYNIYWIFSWPLSDLEREIFWYELHPFSGIMIFFPDNFNFLR